VGNTSLKREVAGIALLLFRPVSRRRGARAAGDGGVRVVHGGEERLRACRRVPAKLVARADRDSRGAAAPRSFPAVHALRLFGRLESETDRSWLVFLIGFVVILPIALGMARGVTPASSIRPPGSGAGSSPRTP
jgi:hypothetical protein